MRRSGQQIAVLALMGLYCWSPLVATIVNLAMLLVCARFFLWTQRRLVFWFDMVAGPWLAMLFAPKADATTSERRVYLADAWRGWPRYTQLVLRGGASEGWTLTRRCCGLAHQESFSALELEEITGLLHATLRLTDSQRQTVELYCRVEKRFRSDWCLARVGS